MAVRAPARRTQTKSRPPLRVVEGKGAARRRRWAIPIVIATVLTVFGGAALHATMSQEGLRAAKLEREVAEQTERLTLMRARVAQLSNPGRVADEAAKLGLVGDPAATRLEVPMEAQTLPSTGPRPLPPDPLKKLNSR
jgi:hypothetical protein